MEDTTPEHSQPQKQAEQDGGCSGEEKLKLEANNDSVYPGVADDGKVGDFTDKRLLQSLFCALHCVLQSEPFLIRLMTLLNGLN